MITFAIDRPFHGNCGFTLCLLRQVGVNVISRADIGVAQKFLGEFEVAGLGVDKASNRIVLAKDRSKQRQKTLKVRLRKTYFLKR